MVGQGQDSWLPTNNSTPANETPKYFAIQYEAMVVFSGILDDCRPQATSSVVPYIIPMQKVKYCSALTSMKKKGRRSNL